MDREYFQHVEEASSSALRSVSRTVAIAAYSIMGVYMLSIAMPAILPVAVSDVLPRMIDVQSNMGMLVNVSHEYDMIDHGEL